MKNSLKCVLFAMLLMASACSKEDNNENLSGNSSTVKTTGLYFNDLITSF